MNPPALTTLAHALTEVHRRIEEACRSAGRDPHGVQLLAVSKTFGADAVADALTAGQLAFGENYVQEGCDKIAALRAGCHPRREDIQWHCIGPIQSNKPRLVAEHFDWVHTIDRLKTAQRLSDQRPADRPPLQVCLQVNVDGGANKSGAAPQDILPLARAVAGLPHLVLRGLMSIPEPVEGHAAQVERHRLAKAVFDSVALALQQDPPAGGGHPPRWDTLSLGMSGDLEAAIQAGSTLVRVGTAIFGGRPRAAGAPA